ncbi:hypothetical protein COCC4DRAFT_34689 [Bipolaris maydis ATCC 48331]|uniref:Secreted protein n=2 Tax=Cochliobolus heterostrophus TaxID=5016 RepID=M2TGZ1_COCH5|nr:uncharacterized protein COCC4DRAFT_34689 [Bipolaris maydis ATCC 48331]EMD85769.1 hypothetical protein COCHEDRAFT_1024364 [Bipolaris maydis C5]ENH99844.1 hypothetical protein COCC4DRAFT_34689 [Bipolaris maydis ATCC 48331]
MLGEWNTLCFRWGWLGLFPFVTWNNVSEIGGDGRGGVMGGRERNIKSGLYIYAHTTSLGMKEFTPAGWKHFNPSQVGLHCAEFESCISLPYFTI